MFMACLCIMGVMNAMMFIYGSKLSENTKFLAIKKDSVFTQDYASISKSIEQSSISCYTVFVNGKGGGDDELWVVKELGGEALRQDYEKRLLDTLLYVNGGIYIKLVELKKPPPQDQIIQMTAGEQERLNNMYELHHVFKIQEVGELKTGGELLVSSAIGRITCFTRAAAYTPGMFKTSSMMTFLGFLSTF